MDWFERHSGFQERHAASEFDVAGHFELSEDELTLTSRCNGRSFGVGAFETPSLRELRARLREQAPTKKARLGRRFENVIGDVSQLHFEHPNAVFQVASRATQGRQIVRRSIQRQ